MVLGLQFADMKCFELYVGKICGANHVIGGNIETKSKHVLRSFKKKMKFDTFIVHTHVLTCKS